MKETVIINEKDNVGITLAGTDTIPAGHKFALKDISSGEYVIKYGEIIGRATADIKKGEWVHTHNVKSHLDETVAYRYEFSAEKPKKRIRLSAVSSVRKAERVSVTKFISFRRSGASTTCVCVWQRTRKPTSAARSTVFLRFPINSVAAN